MLEVLFFFNVITASFAKNIPKFYTECLKEWEIYQQKQISASSHILDQIIWNNKFIKIGGRSLYRCALVNKGIVRIKDILDTESKLHKWNVLKDRHITQAEYFILMSIYDALPLGWKMLLKEGRERNRQTAKFTFPSSSKTLYWDIISKYEIEPTAKRRYEELYPMLELPWQEIYILPRKTTLESKAREFQYKLLNRIIYTNKILHKIGKTVTPLCSFCSRSEESLEHLFIYCEFANSFWLSVTNWLEGYGMSVNVLSAADITFGIYEKNLQLINHIILLGKQNIYLCRSLSLKPSLTLLIEKVKYTYKLESWIAESNNSLDIHNNKWKSLLSAL